MIVAGLDISCTNTGIAFLGVADGVVQAIPKVLMVGSIPGPKKMRGLDRASYVAGEVLKLYDNYLPELVVMEGYAFAKPFAMVPLVEIGTVIRYFTRQRGLDYVDVAPTKLKKFVTGSGNAKKDQMMMHVFKRWRFEAPNSDEADAYGLACMGLSAKGSLLGTKEMVQLTAKIFDN